MKVLVKITVLIIFNVLLSCNSKSLEGVQGKVKRDAIMVVSKYPGRIMQINVQEGDKVRRGDTLMVLHMPEVEAKLEQARGAVNSARAQYQMALHGATNEQLNQVVAKLDAVTEQYDFARKSYERIHNMFKDSLVSVQKHDEVYMKYQATKAQLDGVRAKYDELKKGVRSEKVQMALGTYERAKGALQEAKVAYSERFLLAPKTMTIETIALNEGELVLPGYGAMTGYVLEEVFFRFTIPESQIHHYKLGQSIAVCTPFSDFHCGARVISVKQLTRYANITSAFPEYELGEVIYELKALPEKNSELNALLTNMTVLLK